MILSIPEKDVDGSELQDLEASKEDTVASAFRVKARHLQIAGLLLVVLAMAAVLAPRDSSLKAVTAPSRALSATDLSEIDENIHSVAEDNSVVLNATGIAKTTNVKSEVEVSGNQYGGPWHYGACPSKGTWPNVKAHCEGCAALVNQVAYGKTCDAYCSSQGLQCIGAWEAGDDSCTKKGWSECSAAIPSNALCECILPCSGNGETCSASKCCGHGSKCFETNPETHQCMSSCTPHMDGTCKQSFSHPLGQARQTWGWPDIACVISDGEVLVLPDAFKNKYDSDCQQFCVNGAGASVHGNAWQYWMSVGGKGTGVAEVCPGKPDSQVGVRCHCSFPDRL